MTRHIIRRLVQAIPTIFGITIISYLIMSLAPGGPAALLTFESFDSNSGGTNVSVATQMQIERLGLNDPWYIQYLTWLTGNDWMWWKNQTFINPETGLEELRERPVSYGILRGDFGESFRSSIPASELILSRIPATMELGIASLLVGLLVGIPIGLLAAIWRGGIFDQLTRILAVVGNAIPNFWFGLMLILLIGVMLDGTTIFGFELNTDWARGDRCDIRNIPRELRRDGGCGSIPIWQRLEYLILPTIVLSYGLVANYSRFMRTSMLDTINSDYVRTARAKGLQNRTIWVRHAARNSLIPLATFLGPAIVGVLSGAVITESIFNWPGLGLLVIKSVSGRDFPVVMASVLITSILTVIAYIISDILYALFDPRIRF